MENRKKGHVIDEVSEDSIAGELEIEAGDVLLSINGKEITDVLDYRFWMEEEKLLLLVEKKNGEEWELEIEKEMYEDIGLVFRDGLMDEYRSCKNKCVFCFIDQLPKGMRDTLYFKDDDSRLSFLQGNYITLTNLSEKDMSQIIRYHLSPINISVHTTNPELRCKMLNNRFAGEALEKLQRFYDAGITMNGQIVLCKGYNDGAELERTIHDLTAYLPYMESVSVVPVGLTKYREGLAKLEPFTKEDAKEVIGIVEKWQKIIYEHYHTRMIHASDEWYLTAGLLVPSEENYEGYPQMENGVGMVRMLCDSVDEVLAGEEGDDRTVDFSIATGTLAAPILQSQLEKVQQKFPNIHVRIYPITNRFFGERITVAGLITAGDLIEQLKEKEIGDFLAIPDVCLRSGEDVFLDDLHVTDVEKALQKQVRIVKSEGDAFVMLLLGKEEDC